MTHSPLDEVRTRYAAERARRVRDDRDAQYGYLDDAPDPWNERVERAPLTDVVDVAVVGAGLSGLTTAATLKKEGVERVRLIDRAGDVGGTWYWNRYPAAQCDVESYVYLPLLDEMGYVPTEKYAYQGEILAYLQSVARRFDLYRDACFHTGVEDAAWDEAEQLWVVETDRGDRFRAHFLVLSGGFLQRPKLPAIPGLSEFQGTMFHSSRWDYAYTGGGPGRDGGGLPGLRDKRVGVIGTGASGLQIVTPLAKAAEHLVVFQRTPSTVLPRNNRPTDPEWASILRPGWHRERVEFFEQWTNGRFDQPDVIADGWTEVYAPVAVRHGAGLAGGPQEQEQAELADLAAMDRVRQRIAETVRDPDTAAALMPYYPMLCKRVGFHDDYLDAFNRPNVTLVDTRGAGVEKVTANAVIAEGREYELDLLILATGFDTVRGYLRSWGFDVVGRAGLRLSEHWRDGMRTMHGVTVRHFPNLFLVAALTQNAITVNYGAHAGVMAEHISYVVGEARSRGHAVVEASEQAEAAWADMVASTASERQTEFLRSCTPGYYNNEGNLESRTRQGSARLGGGSVAYHEILRGWRSAGTLSGLDCS